MRIGSERNGNREPDGFYGSGEPRIRYAAADYYLAGTGAIWRGFGVKDDVLGPIIGCSGATLRVFDPI
jgi:hypothetical protein